jgi:hypothetical protein
MDLYLDCCAWRGYRRPEFPVQSWAVEGDALRALAQGPRIDATLQAAWQSGLEMQLLDNGMHPDGRVPETSCGALYG